MIGKGKEKASTTDSVGCDDLLNFLKGEAAKKAGEDAFNVAVVGVTNVIQFCTRYITQIAD